MNSGSRTHRILQTVIRRTRRHPSAQSNFNAVCLNLSRVKITSSTSLIGRQYSTDINQNVISKESNDVEAEINEEKSYIEEILEEDDYELTESPSTIDTSTSSVLPNDLSKNDDNGPLTPETLASYMVKRTDASIDYGSIYWENEPHLDRTQLGEELKRRLVWEEQDCSTSFPATPEDAGLPLLHYLEQRDMWQRRQVLDIPKFCVGSIVAVTRGDGFSEEGYTRFVGLCIHINRFRNSKKHVFTLRNVINNEALEIRYPYYNPLIHKIEVLRHERWDNEVAGVGLRFLRDFPLEYSTVSEKMVAEPYTDEPSVRVWSEKDAEKLRVFWKQNYEARHPPCTIAKNAHLMSYETPGRVDQHRFLVKKRSWRMLKRNKLPYHVAV